MKHSHCHRCPESSDCDVEDFLTCETPKDKKFNKCSCFLCIDNDKLREIIQSYQKDQKPKKRRYEEPGYYEEMFEETTL